MTIDTTVTQDELDRRLTSWQRAALHAQQKRGTLQTARYVEETETLEMVLRDPAGMVVKIGPPKYLAPRFRRLVILAEIAGVAWLAATGRLPLQSDYVLIWTALIGTIVGFMSAWPHRHPHPQKFLRYVTLAATAFEMHELFEAEHHHHDGRMRATIA